MFSLIQINDIHERLGKHFSLHEQGKTNYVQMSQGLAESGIEKWTFDTNRMTIVYDDTEGNEMLVEIIE